MIFNGYLAYIKDNPKGWWFRAKLYGWGWTPARWRGWAVLLAWLLIFTLNMLRFDLRDDSAAAVVEFFIETAILVAALIFICYKTGERPRWQWGPPKNMTKHYI